MRMPAILSGVSWGGNLVSTGRLALYVSGMTQAVETWFPRPRLPQAGCGAAMPRYLPKAAGRIGRRPRFTGFTASSAAQAAPRSVHHG